MMILLLLCYHLHAGYLQFVLHVMLYYRLNKFLYFYISIFQSMWVVSNMADIYSSLILCFPIMLLQ